MDRFQSLRSFVSVVDAGSFVAAADALGLSKAAVSRHVNQLEAHLDQRLLQRTTRRLSLTPEGELFLARSRDILASLEEAEAEISERSARVSGLLRINVPVTYGIRRLAPMWGALREEHPALQLDITLADRQVDLIEEGVDLVIRIGSLASSSLISRRLASTRLILCAHPDYLAAHGWPRAPGDLADHAVIGYSYLSSGDEWRLHGPEGDVAVRTRPIIHCNNGDTCRALALAGQGIVLQPDFLVEDDLAAGRLVEILPEHAAGIRGIYAVYPSRRHMSPKLRAVIRFLEQRLEGDVVATPSADIPRQRG